MYLEHYLDSLEHLPIELQRNFTLMRDLDARAQTLMKNIDKQASEYLHGLRNAKASGPDKRKEQMSNIQKLFNKAKEYGDDKVQLAIQTYELVDKHIRRLDSDLARFEAEIQDKAAAGSSRSADEGGGHKSRNRKTKEKEKKKRGSSAAGASSEEETVAAKARKKQKRAGSKAQTAKAVEASATTPLSSLIGAHTTEVLDMPVDPNEPTYCLCHQVSYGEMIGCDNPDCPIEWFHFACVGLVTKPKGKWYCPKCTADRKKK